MSGVGRSVFLWRGEGVTTLWRGCTGDEATSSLLATSRPLSLAFPLSLMGVSEFPHFFLSSESLREKTIDN